MNNRHFAPAPKKILKEMKKYPKFYQKVWLECLKIPAGKTITYSALAKKIGCPKGARAIAQSLAKNPFAPVIPCHRVIRKDGGLGGYSGPGGIKTKRRLLNQESKKN